MDEKRKHARLPHLKEKGYIESVIVDGTLIELQKPIEMETCNISGNGILIQTMAGSGDSWNGTADLRETWRYNVTEDISDCPDTECKS